MDMLCLLEGVATVNTNTLQALLGDSQCMGGALSGCQCAGIEGVNADALDMRGSVNAELQGSACATPKACNHVFGIHLS